MATAMIANRAEPIHFGHGEPGGSSARVFCIGPGSSCLRHERLFDAGQVAGADHRQHAPDRLVGVAASADSSRRRAAM